MSIVKMKRLRLIALAQDRDALLSSLLHVGCVEISEPEELPQGEDGHPLLHRDAAGVAQAKAQLTALQHALEVLRKYAPYKTGMFTPRDTIGEKDLLDEKAMAAALSKAEAVNEHAKVIGQLNTREARLHTDQLALQPWSAYDLPLEDQGTKCVTILLGTVPNAVDFDAMAGAVAESAEASWLKLLSTDREQQYLEVIVHRSQEQAALETLRSYGFSFSQLKELTGTVAENIRRMDEEIRQVGQQRQQEQEAIRALGADRHELEICVDRVQQVLAKEDAKERLLAGGAIICLDGWASAPEVPALEKALKAFDCAYELTDPTPEEYPQVPVKLKNSVFSRCMNVVTEMYSLPAYDGVDPNGLMAPFYIFFFGFMFADLGYGLLLAGACLFIQHKVRPKGGFGQLIRLMTMCGVSSAVIGLLTGGFFSDFLVQFTGMLGLPQPAVPFLSVPEGSGLPAPLLNVMEDPMTVLVFALAVGFVQIVVGMAVKFWMLCRDGQVWDAVWDVGTWWVIFAGIGLFALNLTGVSSVGSVAGIPVVLVLGCLMLLAQGRSAKGFGKVTAVIGAVYNGVTGYFGDILSYSRLMVMMLAGSVIGQVFNILGAMPGGGLPPAVGIPIFFVIFIVGHAFNIGLNVIGTYVHTSRLQYLEFFKQFYKEGGRPWRPLNIATKFVDIKEEQ